MSGNLAGRQPMPLEDMVRVVEESLQGLGVHVQVDRARKRPRLFVSTPGRPGRWVRLEIDDEVFIVDVDTGYQLVASEMWATEQAELLADLSQVAIRYLREEYDHVQRRSWTGRPKDFLVIRANAEQYRLKRR